MFLICDMALDFFELYGFFKYALSHIDPAIDPLVISLSEPTAPG